MYLGGTLEAKPGSQIIYGDGILTTDKEIINTDSRTIQNQKIIDYKDTIIIIFIIIIVVILFIYLVFKMIKKEDKIERIEEEL